MKDIDFNELIKEAYEGAKERGFHNEAHTDGHWIMLVACELAEAVEADREGRRADRATYNFLLQEYGEELEKHLFEMHIKDTLEDELADAVIRLMDYMGMKGYSMQTGFISKSAIRTTLDNTFFTDEWKDMKTFAERLFIAVLANLSTAVHIPESTIFSIFSIAELYEIDLLWYIKEKMRYNNYREFMHGKQY